MSCRPPDSPFLQNSHRQPADANQLLLAVDDPDIPYMRRPPDMQRQHRPENISFPHPPDMIGIDLQSHTNELLRVDHQGGSDTAQRLRQDRRSAPMQQPIWLSRPLIYGHPGLQEIVA